MSLAQLILSFARFALADSAATDQRSHFLLLLLLGGSAVAALAISPLLWAVFGCLR